MARRILRTGAYSSNYATDQSMLTVPRGQYTKSTTKCIIGCHGRNGDAVQYSPVSPLGPLAWYLVDNGRYALLSVDHARINSWLDPDGIRAMDDALAYLTTLGFYTTRVGLMGWSMGGGLALNWAKRNPSRVSGVWCWNPVTDLRFFHDTSGSYTPAYPGTGATQAPTGWPAEIDTAFAASTTSSGSVTIPASGGAGVTVTVANAKGFTDQYRGATLGYAQATTTTPAGTFTYTSKDDTHLYGCVSTGAAISVTASTTVAQTYTQARTIHNPYEDYAGFRSQPFKVKISQASDDTTVPPGMNNDATNGFVAKVADANVTSRTPHPTGGHTGSLAGYGGAGAPTVAEVQAFYDALTWT